MTPMAARTSAWRYLGKARRRGPLSIAGTYQKPILEVPISCASLRRGSPAPDQPNPLASTTLVWSSRLSLAADDEEEESAVEVESDDDS